MHDPRIEGENHRAGTIAAAIANGTYPRKDRRAWRADDFFPKPGGSKRDRSMVRGDKMMRDLAAGSKGGDLTPPKGATRGR